MYMDIIIQGFCNVHDIIIVKISVSVHDIILGFCNCRQVSVSVSVHGIIILSRFL